MHGKTRQSGWMLTVLLLAAQSAPLPAQTAELEPDSPAAGAAAVSLVDPLENPPVAPERPEPTAAERGTDGFTGSMRGGPPGYSVTGLPEQNVRGQAATLSAFGQLLNVGCPIWTAGPDKLILRAAVGSMWYDSAAVFPSGTPFPDEVWNVSLGAMHLHRFDNGWSSGLMVNGGSASDRPFAALNVLDASVLAFVRIPHGPQNAWTFSLFYSTTSELPFPMPGLAYLWRPSEQFQASIGIPFQFSWRPWTDVCIEGSYMPVTRVRLQASWRPGDGPLALLARFDWDNQGYFLADRTADQDRFFSYAMTLAGGVRYDVFRHGALQLNAGYAFDRFYFIGRDFDDRRQDRIDVEPGAFLSAAFQLRF